MRINLKRSENQRGHWCKVGSEYLRLAVGPFGCFAAVIRLNYKKDRCAEMKVAGTIVLEMQCAPIDKAKAFAEDALERALQIGLRDLQEPTKRRRA